MYKDLLINLVERDLKLKYKGSVIGFLWSLVNPLVMLVIYTWVFKSILKNNTPNFSLFLMSGLMPWNFFASSIMNSVGAFTSNASLLTKVKLPKYILVLSNILFNFIVFIMMMGLMIIAKIVFGVPFSISFLYLPLAIFLQLVFLFSLGIILAMSNVFFHDTSHLVEVILMAWFWLTPVIYEFGLIPSSFQFYVSLNPMTLIVNLYQAAIAGVPIYTNILWPLIIIAVTALTATYLYIKNNKKIAELV